MKKYVLALDQGTTSSRAILFDREARPIAVKSKEFKQYYPQPGWVEHDAEEIWQSQLETAREVLKAAGVSPAEIAAVGLTNQRETAVVWDKTSGKPLCPAIVWQCRRTADFCRELQNSEWHEKIRTKTGLITDAYFSASKLHWMLEHVEGARAKAERGELLFGTVDSWLIWKLSGGKIHQTDYSNASRTMMYHIHDRCWDEEILELLRIPPSMLPVVGDSSGRIGMTDPALFGEAIPISGVAGDQQAALFGQTCFESGSGKNTYGTGCFLLLNTGEQAPRVDGLLTTIAWGIEGKISYALEGSIFIAGAAVQWLRDELQLIRQAAETEELAAALPDNGGVYLVPAFTGLGTPYWDPYARGTITGLTRGSGRAHIVRAALEAIAYQTRDVLETMTSRGNIPLTILKADGGATANRFLMQFQADILDVPVEVPQVKETTALGAAMLAGLAEGFWKDLDELKQIRRTETVYAPAMPPEQRQSLYEGWKKAVRQTQSTQSF